MKSLKNIIALFSILALSSCVNELDNYDEPNGGIYGNIVDEETNQPVPLPVQGPSGVIIRLMEQGTNATKPYDFYAKQDGSFVNTKVFNCDYLISVEGPFARKEEVRATIKGQTEVKIPVLPYARIEATASHQGKKVSIDYTVKKTSEKYNTSEVYAYWNFAPGVDNSNSNQAGKITTHQLSGSVSFDLEKDNTFKENEYKIKANGNKIYLRIGAMTEGRINYSQVITLTL